MENDAADMIRRKQRIKHLLAEIVESLKDYFDELQLKKFGQKSRFVVLNDINSIHKIGSKGLQLVTAVFNSELGSLTLTIAIKSFVSTEETLQNKILTNKLADKLKDTGVLTPRVIFDHGTMLIYEGIQGETFFDSTINEDIKLRLSGEALSKFHSSELRPVDKTRYLFILKTVFKDLIIPAERKKDFIDLASKNLALVLRYSSGTASFGDFHPGNILFSTEIENGNKVIQTWLIDPEYTEEEKSSDRMEDIGTFFLHSAIDHFDKEGNLQTFRMEIQPFIEGYERYLSAYSLSLTEIYKEYELALSFHLGLNVLLESLFMQKRANMDDETAFDRMATCVALANHCWNIGLK
ncbi:MAG: hypothetical protein ACXADY_12015 [Candidatus Hodarchaeales archaeon]|jgi:hypothetical protein